MCTSCHLLSLLVSCVWHCLRPRVASKFLSALWDSGGVSFPDVYLYYLARQLSNLTRWGLKELILPPSETYYSMVKNLLVTLYVTTPFCCMARTLYHTDGFDAHTSLWHCKRLPRLFAYRMTFIGSANGIWYLYHICNESGIKPFSELQSEFTLPSPNSSPI